MAAGSAAAHLMPQLSQINYHVMLSDNALYSLALAAAANRWPLRIRIEGEDQIDPGREAAIRHMAVAWEAGVPDVD